MQVDFFELIVRDVDAADSAPLHFVPIDAATLNAYVPVVSAEEVHDVVVVDATFEYVPDVMDLYTEYPVACVTAPQVTVTLVPVAETHVARTDEGLSGVVARP